MASVTVQPFLGTYLALSLPSTFAFAVRHSGVFWFRGSLSDVTATLRVHIKAKGAPESAPAPAEETKPEEKGFRARPKAKHTK